MKNIDRAVAMLGNLTESDRDWILERLPEASKLNLAKRLNSDHAVASASSVPSPPVAKTNDTGAEHRKQLACADVDKIVELLRSEPPWLIHAALQIAEWPWRDAVLQRLPAAIRVEALQASHGAATPGQPAIESLLRILVERVGEGHADAVRKSQFELLLTRFGRKARRA